MLYIKNIFKERRSLMGVAMIMVILYHLHAATGSPIFLSFYMGFMGVDIFLILSAYGLCYAFKKYDLKTYYRRRVLRIFPLYVFLAFIVTLIHVLLGNNVSVGDWFSNITTLSYYGIGGFFIEWYLCTLLVLYMLFPILYNLISKWGGYFIATSLLIIILLSTLLDISWIYECALGRLPFFMCGILIFKKTEIKTFRFMSFVYGIALLVVFMLRLYGCLDTYIVVYMTAPFVLIACSCFVQKISVFQSVKKVIEWIGEHSLELYVANVCTLNVVRVLDANLAMKVLLYFVIQILFLPLCMCLNNQIQKISFKA